MRRRWKKVYVVFPFFHCAHTAHPLDSQPLKDQPMTPFEEDAIDIQYEALLNKLRYHGVKANDRTNTGIRFSFGERLEYDLSLGFPAITTKKLHFKSVVAELLWFLSGSTTVADLRNMGSRIWDEWERPDGTIGPGYGKQWRNWTGHKGSYDQIHDLVYGLKKNPDSRRHIVSAWNVDALEDMALPPCHVMFQCCFEPNANGERSLSLQVYQRSADLFLGVPFNIASYALLTHMLAREVGCKAGRMIWVGGNVHLYENHIEQVDEQLSRMEYFFPTLKIDTDNTDIFRYKPEDFSLPDYRHHPAIPAPIAV